MFGEVPAGAALLRSGARAGDDLYVSGTLGDARLALEAFRGKVALAGDAFAQVRRAMELPPPRVALGLRAARHRERARSTSPTAWPATSAMCCAAPASAPSSTSTRCRAAPCSPPSRSTLQRECLLAGGDDYELLFTAPPSRATPSPPPRPAPGSRSRASAASRPASGLRFVDRGGAEVAGPFGSFDHFRA